MDGWWLPWIQCGAMTLCDLWGYIRKEYVVFAWFSWDARFWNPAIILWESQETLGKSLWGATEVPTQDSWGAPSQQPTPACPPPCEQAIVRAGLPAFRETAPSDAVSWGDKPFPPSPDQILIHERIKWLLLLKLPIFGLLCTSRFQGLYLKRYGTVWCFKTWHQ